VPDCDEARHGQEVADGSSSACEHSAAAPCAGIAIERRDADKGSEFSAVEAAKFRQIGDAGSGGNGTYAWHGGEEVFRLAPGGRGAHARGDVGEFLFEEGDMAAPFEPFRRDAASCDCLTVPGFGGPSNSCSSKIRPIRFGAKIIGEHRAGNPQATFDVAGAKNGPWSR